jgi:hypothetical protein
MSIHNLKIKRFSLHQFEDRDTINFDPNAYSRLKYGSGEAGKQFGEELAVAFYEKYYDVIATKQLVVSESAYQYMRNAASMITDAFCNKLNSLISELNGNYIQRIKINRLVPYIQDYGKVSLKQRVKLLKKDTFTFDYDYAKNKFLIFIDDIFITGTHQKKIEEMVEHYGIDTNECMCVYYAELLNPYEDPSIESYLNNYKIKTLRDLGSLMLNDKDYRIIVRTAKMILSYEDTKEVDALFDVVNKEILTEIYYNCLGEGYYKNPAYSKNFAMLRDKILK